MVDSGILNLIPFMTVLGVGCLLAILSRKMTGMWINTVTAMLGSWVPMAAILVGRWVDFFLPEVWFFFLICSSVAAFILGGCLFHRVDHPCPVPCSVDRSRFEKVLQWTCILGVIGFLGYSLAAVQQVGWRGYILHPDVLRVVMTRGAFSDPAKLINYANIVFPVLVVIGNECLGGIARKWWILGILSAATNFLSTGRTKVIWVLIWGALVVIISREGKDLRKTLVVAGSALLLSLAVFGGMAVWMRKYFTVVEIARYAPDIPDEMGLTYTALYYIGAGLPYLQEAMETDIGGEGFFLPNLLTPIYKTLNLISPDVPVCSEILPTLPTPAGANTGTWLVQFFMDLGIPGLIFLPLIVGAFTSWLLARGDWPRNHPMRLYFGGLMLYIIWIGFLANKFISTPTWMFILLGFPVLKWVCAGKLDAAEGSTPVGPREHSPA